MRGIISIILLLTILGGTNWYLALRLHQGLACFFEGLRFWPVMLTVCILVLLLVMSFVRGLTLLPKDIKNLLGLIGGYGMGILLYLLLFTVAADLLLLIPQLLKLPFTMHHLYHGFVILGVLLLTVTTCVGGFANTQRLHHVSYEVPLQDRQDISDLKVVMISDLHLGAVGSEKRLENIVNELNSLNPDVICIAGDFFDTDFASIQDPDAAIVTLNKLRSTYGIYACLGNHDGGQTHSQMKEFLRQANITLLEDSYAVIDNRLVLVGRLDGAAIGGYDGQSRKALSEFFEREDDTLPVVVLDHNPAHIDEYTDEADLILCGHTHKGQVFPANLVTGAMYTVDYGYYRKDAQSPQVIVTSGVGAWGMPMRVGTNCEIVSIKFN